MNPAPPQPTTQLPEPLAGSPVARLQPRTAPQLLDAGFEVLKFRARTIVTILVLTHGPFFAGSILLARYGGNGSLWHALGSRAGGIADPFRSERVDYLWPSLSFGCLLAGEMVFGVALSTLVRAWMEGRDPGPLEIVRGTLVRLPVILVTWSVALVVKVAAAALCLVGLLLAVPPLSIAAPVMAFEPGNPFRWLGRSRELTSRASGQALFLTLLAPALSASLWAALRLGEVIGITYFQEFMAIMAVVVTLLVLVARTSAAALFYLDIRVRTEGLDLAIRAPHALGATP